MFHEQHHKQIQYLIDWFKQNYRDRNYVRSLKRQRSPRAKVPESIASANQRDASAAAGGEPGASGGWANVQREWGAGASERNTPGGGGNSVHSANDYEEQKQSFSRP